MLASSTPKPSSAEQDKTSKRKTVDEDLIVFLCQQCHTALRMDSNFSEDNPEIKSLIDAAKNDEASKPCDEIPSLDLHATSSGKDSTGLSVPTFVVPPIAPEEIFSVSGLENPEISRQLMSNALLFDILSKRTTVRQPLCQKCADILVTSQTTILEFQRDELSTVKSYLKYLEKKAYKTKTEQDTVDDMNRSYKLAQKLSLHDESEQQDSDSQAWDSSDSESFDENKLKEAEETLASLQAELENVEAETVLLEEQAKQDAAKLEHLEKDLNKFIQKVSDLLDFSLVSFEIVPRGDQSFVKSIAQKKELPLYYPSVTSRLFTSNVFDLGMAAYLDCLGQLMDFLRSKSSKELKFVAHLTDKHKLRDVNSGQSYSIKYSGNSEETWTCALRLMLVNLKYIISVCSALSAPKSE
ncbi:Beclin-1 [Cichlidogyrus casuarinus]|uniref:Beclin-1 n=1 Tax=Cichlidogyrus casuarinus TaxID=1844966 RepID=A0ABD2QAQ6_9PLAT